jgi:hypothetical protein
MKGQLTIEGILMAVMAIIVVAMLAPLLYQVISGLNGNATAAGDTMTPVISVMIVPFLVLGVVISIVVYVLAGRRVRNEQG